MASLAPPGESAHGAGMSHQFGWPVMLDQALNDRNDGLNCLPAMTGANPLAPFP